MNWFYLTHDGKDGAFLSRKNLFSCRYNFGTLSLSMPFVCLGFFTQLEIIYSNDITINGERLQNLAYTQYLLLFFSYTFHLWSLSRDSFSLSLLHLMWHQTSFCFHLRVQVTLEFTPVAVNLPMKLSLPVLTTCMQVCRDWY